LWGCGAKRLVLGRTSQSLQQAYELGRRIANLSNGRKRMNDKGL